MNAITPPTLGVLLAGGLARRMGGVDKASCKIGDRTLIERVTERMTSQCGELIVSANGDPSRFSALKLPVISDSSEGFAGPLAGILAALDWMAALETKYEWLLSVSTDCPFLPRDLVSKLHQTRQTGNAELAVAASDGRAHHAIALWPLTLRDDLRRALTLDTRKVARFTSRYKIATVTWPIESYDPFFNVNTLDDLAEAERLALSIRD